MYKRQGYIRAVRQLAEFSQLAPDQLTEEHVRRWLLHLKVEQQRAYGTLRVAFSGIKFFFTRTSRRVWNLFAETKLQNIKAKPAFLNRELEHRLRSYVTSRCQILICYLAITVDPGVCKEQAGMPIKASKTTKVQVQV